MDIITLLAVATGLSFDTFAISLTCGVTDNRIRFHKALRVAIIMAFFQGSFAIIGYFAGSVISGGLEAVDHWVAMGLLSFLGLRMIVNGVLQGDNRKSGDITSLPSLITMSVGTSIDALAVGVSFAFLSINIWLAGFIIGTVTFLASMIAIRLGISAGKKIGPRTEIAGGLILILIGIKILLEHLYF